MDNLSIVVDKDHILWKRLIVDARFFRFTLIYVWADPDQTAIYGGCRRVHIIVGFLRGISYPLAHGKVSTGKLLSAGADPRKICG